MSGTESSIVNRVPTAVGESSIAYRVAGFEGPLAVLLRLIEREELDITAISLAQVADQFIAHIEAQADSDPGLLAEFAAVASRQMMPGVTWHQTRRVALMSSSIRKAATDI